MSLSSEDTPLPPFIIYGAGEHGRVVFDAARSAGIKVDRMVDDKFAGEVFQGVPICSGTDFHAGDKPFSFIVAIGNNKTRAEVFLRLRGMGGIPMSIAHRSAVISPLAQIGAGTILAAGTVVNPGARIGINCIINTCASVDHDCLIEQHAFIGPGVRLAGTVIVEESATVYTGAIVIPGIRIGKNSLVGAGAVVLREVPAGATVFGNPARLKAGKKG